MMDQKAGHSNDGVGQNRPRSKKLKSRAAALKIGKMIKRCKAENKAIRSFADEQMEYLERLRKHS
jgi:hypothetical protein